MDLERELTDLNMKGISPLDFYQRLQDHLRAIGDLPPHRKLSRIITCGHLSIYRLNDDGSRWLLHSDWNKITNIGFQTLAEMWGEPDSPDTFDGAKPATIGIGAQSQPSAPSLTDTDLQQRVFTSVFDQRIFIGAPTSGVQFEMTVPKVNSATDNTTITEAGLFRADDVVPTKPGLIARQTFAGIPKNNTFQLLFQWKFTFTEA